MSPLDVVLAGFVAWHVIIGLVAAVLAVLSGVAWWRNRGRG